MEPNALWHRSMSRAFYQHNKKRNWCWPAGRRGMASGPKHQIRNTMGPGDQTLNPGSRRSLSSCGMDKLNVATPVLGQTVRWDSSLFSKFLNVLHRRCASITADLETPLLSLTFPPSSQVVCITGKQLSGYIPHPWDPAAHGSCLVWAESRWIKKELSSPSWAILKEIYLYII